MEDHDGHADFKDWIQDLGPDGQIFERFVFQDGNLVDFYQEHQFLLDGVWWPVVRLSWSGGKILQEEFPKGSSKPLPQVNEFGESADIWEARDYAYDNLTDETNLDERIGRYLDG